MQENPLRPVTNRFPKLEKDAKTDILIVGGGITGVSCSYFLNNAGYETMVVEMDEVGSGASGASSGILYYGSGTNLVPAIKMWGRETAEYMWKETAENIKELIQLIKKLGIDCGFRQPGGIMLSKTDEEARIIEDEQKELQKIGLKHPLLKPDEIKSFYNGENFKSGLHFHDCGQIYPAVFAADLAKKTNMSLFESTKMEGFEQEKDGFIVKTSGGKVRCSKIIFATNDFPVPPEKSFGLENHFVQQSSVILGSQPANSHLKKFFPTEKVLWTIDENYDIIYPHEDRLILELYRLDGVEQKLASYYPGFDFQRELTWGSSWARVKDWLPLAGEFQKNVYTAMAMSDQGTTMGFTTAKHVVEMVEGKKNKYLELADPKRIFKK